jgi:hypothetical protein
MCLRWEVESMGGSVARFLIDNFSYRCEVH